MVWLLALGKCPGIKVLVLTPAKFEEFKESDKP